MSFARDFDLRKGRREGDESARLNEKSASPTLRLLRNWTILVVKPFARKLKRFVVGKTNQSLAAHVYVFVHSLAPSSPQRERERGIRSRRVIRARRINTRGLIFVRAGETRTLEGTYR